MFVCFQEETMSSENLGHSTNLSTTLTYVTQQSYIPEKPYAHKFTYAQSKPHVKAFLYSPPHTYSKIIIYLKGSHTKTSFSMKGSHDYLKGSQTPNIHEYYSCSILILYGLMVLLSVSLRVVE